MHNVDREVLIPNTMALKAEAKFLVKIKSKNDLIDVINLAKKEKLPFIPLGCGSNILPKEKVRAVVGLIKIKNLKQRGDIFEVGAGEIWDNFVKKTVEKGYSGLETLSAIPGTVGACPIQNIGAYGSEVKNTIKSVEVFDCSKNKFRFLKNKECQFGYRASIFKKSPRKFIVVSVSFELKKTKPEIPKYKNLIEYFKNKKIIQPSVKQIRDAVIKIRKLKLPDYKKIPNAGSYFINPIIKGKKIHAGRLIEESGLKGKKIGKIEVFSKNALILTNPNKAKFDEIIKAENFIRQKVFQKFDIALQREPIIIG